MNAVMSVDQDVDQTYSVLRRKWGIIAWKLESPWDHRVQEGYNLAANLGVPLNPGIDENVQYVRDIALIVASLNGKRVRISEPVHEPGQGLVMYVGFG